MQNLLHHSFWYSCPFCYESIRRPMIFLQNISYTSNVFTHSCLCRSSTSLLITNRLSPFWKRFVPTKHCGTMYCRLTINFWIISNVFVAWKPAFQQKQIAARFSVVFSITIYNTDKTDKLRHIANMYLTVNSLSWNLACMEKRVYWRISPSFTEIALLVLCFHIVVLKLTRQVLNFQ